MKTKTSLKVENDDGVSEIDVPEAGPEDLLSDKLLLDSAFKVLNGQERKLISYRYYQNLTQSKTAELLNMTQVQVSRSERKILAKLRNVIGEYRAYSLLIVGIALTYSTISCGKNCPQKKFKKTLKKVLTIGI